MLFTNMNNHTDYFTVGFAPTFVFLNSNRRQAVETTFIFISVTNISKNSHLFLAANSAVTVKIHLTFSPFYPRRRLLQLAYNEAAAWRSGGLNCTPLELSLTVSRNAPLGLSLPPPFR